MKTDSRTTSVRRKLRQLCQFLVRPVSSLSHFVHRPELRALKLSEMGCGAVKVGLDRGLAEPQIFSDSIAVARVTGS